MTDHTELRRKAEAYQSRMLPMLDLSAATIIALLDEIDALKAASKDAETWAELYRLREEVKGPDGFATWKDAAVSERLRAAVLKDSLQAFIKYAEDVGDDSPELDAARSAIAGTSTQADMVLVPRVPTEARSDGWTFDPEYLTQISESSTNEWMPDLEGIEAVLLALNAIEAATKEKL